MGLGWERRRILMDFIMQVLFDSNLTLLLSFSSTQKRTIPHTLHYYTKKNKRKKIQQQQQQQKKRTMVM